MGGGKRWREAQYMRSRGVAGKPERIASEFYSAAPVVWALSRAFVPFQQKSNFLQKPISYENLISYKIQARMGNAGVALIDLYARPQDKQNIE